MNPLSLAKDKLLIPAAWRALGLAGEPAIGMNRSPFREDTNPSFSIYGGGRRWKDFGTGESGSVVDFIMKAKGLTVVQAINEAIRLAGTGSTVTFSTSSLPSTAPEPEPAEVTGRIRPAAWSTVEAAWNEGVEWLKEKQDRRDHLARWRGWEPHWVDHLLWNQLISRPLHAGTRGTAFLVSNPFQAEYDEPEGYHVRYRLEREERVIWKFVPSGIRSYPFWHGNVPEAKRLIVTEGQWDCLTVAGAAGWMDTPQASWPEDVAILGIRGSSGHRLFMKLMEGFLRRQRPEVLVIRDNDQAGERWVTELAPRLGEAAGSVRLFRMNGAKDLNDAHKNKPLTSEEVFAILGEKK